MADPEFDDLMGLDLSTLDLEHIELEGERPPSPWWRWVALVFLLSIVVTVLWIPNTEWYRASSAANWVFATICIVATVVGVLLGRWLWLWAEEAAQRWARNNPRKPAAEKAPPGPFQRWLTLLAALGGGGAILFAITEDQLSGGGTAGYSNIWYLAAFGAIVVGVLLGRWLLMQEYNPFKNAARRSQPIKLPPWFKWVTLAFIVIGSAVILLGTQLFGTSDPDSLEFSLGGASFFIGIVAAIWVARRFDETEAKIRKDVRGRQAPGAVLRTGTPQRPPERATGASEDQLIRSSSGRSALPPRR